MTPRLPSIREIPLFHTSRVEWVKRQSRIIQFPVDCPGEFILWIYPAAIFFFFFSFVCFGKMLLFQSFFRLICKRFSPFYTELSLNYIRKKIFRKSFYLTGNLKMQFEWVPCQGLFQCYIILLVKGCSNTISFCSRCGSDSREREGRDGSLHSCLGESRRD